MDGAGLAVFRILFGAVMLYSVLRFWANGWIDAILLAPSFHFTYFGFDWVRPWPGAGMYLHFAGMAGAALAILVGWRTRFAAAAFFLLFTWAELIEKAAWLNHYYLVSLLALLLVFLPADRVCSLDTRRRPPTQPVTLGAYVLLRVQVGLVYFFAGFAKLGEDWLLRAEPLHTWLQAYADWPLVGPLLALPATAFAMSWAGAVFDLTIPLLLCWRRTRAAAYAAAVVFHLFVGLLFPIGVFPLVMLVAATVFFDPGWPRRLVRRRQPPLDAPQPGAAPVPPGRRARLILAAAYLVLQVALPLRFLLYPGPVSWTQEGGRFAWRVMLVETNGSLEYTVRTTDPPEVHTIWPRDELCDFQYRALVAQPDMIHEYALHLADRYAGLGYRGVSVHARAFASLNGRPSQPLVDERVDLAARPRSLAPQSWIVPLADVATARLPEPSTAAR